MIEDAPGWTYRMLCVQNVQRILDGRSSGLHGGAVESHESHRITLPALKSLSRFWKPDGRPPSKAAQTRQKLPTNAFSEAVARVQLPSLEVPLHGDLALSASNAFPLQQIAHHALRAGRGETQDGGKPAVFGAQNSGSH